MTDLGEWGKLEIVAPDFTPLEKLSGWIDSFKEVLSIVADLLDKILPYISEIPDPTTAAIQAALAALRNMLEGILDDAGVYGIFVPFGKRLATNAGTLCDVTPDTLSFLFPEDNGLSSPHLTASQKEFLIRVNRSNGGNAGFYRMVRDSLHDLGDRNRPQFNTTSDWIGGMTFVMGTGFDPLGLLDDLWGLKGMFGNLFDGSYITKVPVAKNLTVEALERPVGLRDEGTAKGKFRALLKWDGLGVPITRIPDLGDTVIGPERIAIIMVKNDISAANSSNVVQLMGKRELKQGDTFGDATVVYEDSFQVTKVTHMHEVTDAGIDDTYYFTVAYKNKAWRSDQNWTVDPATALGYWETSNIAQAVPFPALPGSTPPDWIRSPSMAELFPDFAYLLRTILGQIDTMATRTLSVPDFISQYVDFLRDEVGRYNSLVQQILTQIQKVTNSLILPSATGGVYARQFAGKGGNQFFLSDLAASLESGFDKAPPFHQGDEYVTGLVLLIGGPTEGEVRAALKLFELIFGIHDEATVNLLDDVGDAVTQLEQVCFGNSFDTVTCETEDEVIFSESVEPLDVSRCSLKSTEVGVKFGDDLNPV